MIASCHASCSPSMDNVLHCLDKKKMNDHPTMRFVAIFAFLVIIPPAATLNFGLTSFSRDNIVFQGSANPINNSIQLTPNSPQSTGRATYVNPLKLWDNASGTLADFTTHFSFVIDSQNTTPYVDGMTFFLASVSPIEPYGGGALGMTTKDELFNATKNPFVAVEFDTNSNYFDPFATTYGKPFDPIGEHVGIDINSINSVITLPWSSGASDGKRHDALITYDSHSKNLTVVLTSFDGSTSVVRTLSHVVDLRDVLPEQVAIGFSASTAMLGTASELHEIHSWNFSSTLQIVEDPRVIVPSPSPPTKGKSKTGLVIGLIIGGSVLVGGSGILLFAFRKRRGRRDYEGETAFHIPEFEAGAGPKKFSYADLARATNNFAEHEKLGEGGFGGVYKGYLRELNTNVAVKRVSKGSSQGLKEYTSEVKTITRLRHRNLVQLIGWCHEKSDELLLVYEFLPNGSLDYHLFKGKSLLTWETRYKIVQDIAAAVLYLHEGWEQCVVHRDIKSSNIMLDSTFNARLGDFGLARLVDHEKGLQTTTVAGTIGYMDSEYLITGKASKETDVYSFGVMALEIACGRRPIVPNSQESEVNLVEWVWSLYGTGKLIEAADPKLSSTFYQQEIEHLMVVGLWCAHPDKSARPSIMQASRVLNFEASLPILPSTMPVAAYDTTPVLMHTFSTTYSPGDVVSQSSQI